MTLNVAMVAGECRKVLPDINMSFKVVTEDINIEGRVEDIGVRLSIRHEMYQHNAIIQKIELDNAVDPEGIVRSVISRCVSLIVLRKMEEE